ncbi:lysophospholipid acyltransferase family protein [Piscinibacter koreensis]|uniref:1-acyl-sn-glycerol-3-phosphate acyltransferase n=1 Tax=Piscinibacter koreensis TaxID=2742824 RepID=A0A7Y6NNL2_9BURK|nr:lysophospholipid acyltransferase family protein [Schlegelella koreensis]NUZ06503.1 1-acyl-sn-glycerol-3-phosphate acyltransferase [Schlegelella koreensis]
MRHALNTLRSALFVLFMAVTVVPWGTTVVLYSVVARGDRIYWLCVGWLRLAIWGARVICGVRARLHGVENLPDEPVILLPKHQSTWETFAFPTLMKHPLCYVFKRELLYIPFFGWAMARMDMIHIDRSRRADAWNRIAEQGRRFMQMGHWVIMFPEGTRAPRGGKGTYKAGGTRLAVETGRPVLPIAVTSARCWPRKSFVLQPGVIDVSYGKPIPSVGREAGELMREVEVWIEAEMRRLDPEAYPAAVPAGSLAGEAPSVR